MSAGADETCAPAPEVSPFAESLKVLNQRVDWIPFGWQRLYADMRIALIAVATPARASATVYGGYAEDGLLYVDSCSDDLVIQGVLRKARSRARNTCTWCGRGGARQRLSGECIHTLCPTCAGLRQLYFELTAVLARGKPSAVEGGTCHDKFGLHLWTAIRSAWPACTAGMEADTPTLNTSTLRPWMQRLWERLDGVL